MPFFRLLLRGFLLFLGVALVGAILMIAFGFIQIQYYYPWKHERNLKAAKEWNDKHWETGDAILLTYAISLETQNGVSKQNEHVLCYSKQYVRPGSLKNRPFKGEGPHGEGVFWPEVPVSEDLSILVDFRSVCGMALRLADNRNKDDFAERYRFAYAIGKYSCFLGTLTADGLNMSGYRIQPPEILALDKVPLREVVSQASMAPDTRFNSPPRPDLGTKLRWDYARMCWAQGRGACIPEAGQVCGTRVE